MNDTAQILTIVKSLKEDNKKIREEMARMRQDLLKQKSKQAWGTALDVTKKTGWTAENLRKHREQHTIEFKVIAETTTGNKVYRYNLNSIPEQFIKKQ